MSENASPSGPPHTDAQVARGGALSYAGLFAGKALTLVSTLVLTRLLTPNDFGLVGYAMLVFGILYVLRSFGMGTVLVYEQGISDEQAGEIFTLAVTAAVVLVAVVFVTAPAVATFFHDGRITTLTRVLSLSFILSSLAEVHRAQLQKRMRFGRRLVPDLVFNLTRGIVAVVLAAAGVGYWSLVWAQLAADTLATATTWIMYPWLPRIRLAWTTSKRILRFGAHVVLLQIAAMIALDVDEVIVGRRLGTTSLGFYALAFTLIEIPTIALASAVAQAAFPAFASLRENPARVGEAYVKVVRYTALVLVPVGLGMAVAAPAFVHFAFSRDWWPMISSLQGLSIYAAVYALGWSATDAFVAIGRPDFQWKLDAAQIVVLVPALSLGAALGGIGGVALARVAVVVPYVLVRFLLVRRNLAIDAASIGSALRAPALAGLALLAVAGSIAVAGRNLDPGALFFGEVVAGAATYIGVLAALSPDLRTRRPWSRVRAGGVA